MVSDHLHSLSQMVRTRATTTPTPTPAPAGQGAFELEEEQRQEAVVEVVGGRPLGKEDEHLAHLILGQ